MKITAALALAFITSVVGRGPLPETDDTMKRHRITIDRYRGDACDRRVGKEHLQIYRCKNLRPGKNADSITYKLPKHHRKDDCDILLYSNFNCVGQPVQMSGGPEMANQCMATPNIKSIYIGPCTGREVYWTDPVNEATLGLKWKPVCGFPHSIC